MSHNKRGASAMRFLWIPETTLSTGLYALPEPVRFVTSGRSETHYGTGDIYSALQFESYEQCRQWCDEHPMPGFIPRSHGFIDISDVYYTEGRESHPGV
jgi:hypothetical protein